MRTRPNVLLTSLLAFALHAGAAAQEIRAVATVPDLADFVRQVGGDKVRVDTLALGTQDPHQVLVQPSFLIALKRADIFFELGLDAEEAWVPSLLKQCSNPRIQPGTKGFVNCSFQVEPLEVPQNLTRAEGMRHRLGNPHYNLDPLNGRRMVINVAAGLIRAFPEHKEEFTANFRRYVATLDAKIQEWSKLAAPLAGKKVVSFHRSFSYLARRYGFQVIGEIETQPGIPPTPTHQTNLIRKMRDQEVKVILCESFYSDRIPNAVAQETGATVHTMAALVGGLPDATDYIAMIDRNLVTLLRAFDLPVERGQHP